MKEHFIKLLFALSLTLLFAAPAFSLDGTAILKKVDANLQPESFESYRKLINIEPNGAKTGISPLHIEEGQRQDCFAVSFAGKRKRQSHA